MDHLTMYYLKMGKIHEGLDSNNRYRLRCQTLALVNIELQTLLKIIQRG